MILYTRAFQTALMPHFTSRAKCFSLLLAGLATAAMLYVLMFEDWEEFTECIKFCFQPDIISILQGRHADDIWAEIKIFVWLALSVPVCVSVYVYLGRIQAV